MIFIFHFLEIWLFFDEQYFIEQKLRFARGKSKREGGTVAEALALFCFPTPPPTILRLNSIKISKRTWPRKIAHCRFEDIDVVLECFYNRLKVGMKLYFEK